LFITDVKGKTVEWDMTFQFNLNNEDPFYLVIKNLKTSVITGTATDAQIVLSGDNEALVRICQGKGDFTHAISREQIIVEKGKVMEVIRLTKAITIVLKTK
jgi:putative sterol carrier protein